MDRDLDGLENQTKEAILIEKKKRFSTVWIVPIVALIIAVILIFQAISQKGIEIKINFKTATGIVAHKSIVKYKDIEVGKVVDVSFSDDLNSVVVTAEIKRDLKNYLTDKTLFWIVHAKLTADSVQGLDTILSGSYIAMYPSKDGRRVKEFQGLEDPPVVENLSNGIRLTLEAKDRGSIQIGSPIYYKKLQAGRVLGYKLSDDNKEVYIDIFVKKPFSDLITHKTKFWESSGIKALIGSDGVEIKIESLTSLLSGGVSFEDIGVSSSATLGDEEKIKEVKNGSHFTLYPDKKSAKRINYARKLYFWVYFEESIRGLKAGAPVEFRGVRIGEVVNFSLIGDKNSANFKIPVLIKVEPERFTITKDGKAEKRDEKMDIALLKRLIKKGLRAQLQTMSLLTGDLFVNLDFHKNVKSAKLLKEHGIYVIPTVPATIETLKSDIQTLLDRLASIPLEEIGKEFKKSIKLANDEMIPALSKVAEDTSDLIRESNNTIKEIKKETLPKLNDALESLDKSLKEAKRSYLNRNSQFNGKLLRLLDEVRQATKSIKSLMNYLQRHPDSILKGK